MVIPKKKKDTQQDFKAILWESADKLRAQMDAAEYKHIVLGLIFLKYISDTFDIEKNLALSNHRVILKPEIVAKIAMHIDLKENENVLILGSTIGYLTAVLSLIAETVIVVEEDDNYIKSSEIATKKNNLNNIIYINKSISGGCIEQSPFNAIIIEGAVDHVPQKLLNQLENGGRLIAILSENGLCNAKMFSRKEAVFYTKQLFPCSLPVLPSFKEKNIFSF